MKLVLKKVPGVISSDVSYEKKQAVVTYDSDKTSPLLIAKAISKELEYKVAVRAQDLTEAELRSGAASAGTCSHLAGSS